MQSTGSKTSKIFAGELIRPTCADKWEQRDNNSHLSNKCCCSHNGITGRTIVPHASVKGRHGGHLTNRKYTHWNNMELVRQWLEKACCGSLFHSFLGTKTTNSDSRRPLLTHLHPAEEVAVENNIHIMELPAHTSHWLQPCDHTLVPSYGVIGYGMGAKAGWLASGKATPRAVQMCDQ